MASERSAALGLGHVCSPTRFGTARRDRAATQPRSSQYLGDLDGVGRGSLANVVADNPEREASLHRRIGSNRPT